MTIAAGTKLGPYEILSQIGAGGMGEVYQAHDTKLGRDVAIKVLPEAFAHDPERLSRFQREAKMLAALNHPNIATIYGLEQSGDTSYLVMELVSGEILADRVKAGPLGIEEALKIGIQIAEALEAAHEKSIIHRDLKPANVKVTPEGKVKVLDFGLAKAFSGDTSTEDIGNSPTLSRAATMQGTILGTAAYMSPEQARGKACNKRADIWAFGCVLYELLTGKQAFHGESTTESCSVLREEPDWQALPENTPLSIRALLRRCLQKEMTRRARDAGDARIEIEEALAAPTTFVAISASPGTKDWRQSLPWAGGLVLSVVVGIAIWNLKPSSVSQSQPVSRLMVNLPQGQQLAGLDNGPAVALSPDGTRLVYVARHGNTQQLYLRALDNLEARPIPGTEGAVNPFFAPDSQWVGFFAGGKLMKVSVSGGAALTLADAGGVSRGASWSSHGMIGFVPTNVSVLRQMSDAGGAPESLTRLEKGEFSHRWPDFLPGGDAVFFVAGSTAINWNYAKIVVQSVGKRERVDLVQGGTQPQYSPSGHLVYAQGGNLMAVPFDSQRLAVGGTAAPVLEGVLQSPTTGAAQYSISATGSLVYVSGGLQSVQSKLVWVNRNGEEQPVAAPARVYMFPRFAPDGQRVAVGIAGQGTQNWLYDLSRDTLTRLTFEGKANLNPDWTPDGKRVAFNSDKEGPPNLYWQLADGSGGLERLTTSQFTQAPSSWSPDGQLLAFIEVAPMTGIDIWVLRLGDRMAQPFLRTPFNETSPQFSPDGHWLAYISDESGRFEVYVQPYPGPGGKWQISTEGGTEPLWNPNGRELFYRSGDKMMAVDISTQPSFSFGKPKVLFEGTYELTPATLTNYDVLPGGQRFLMLKPIEQDSPPTQINVVLNWFEELKQKVPVGKK